MICATNICSFPQSLPLKISIHRSFFCSNGTFFSAEVNDEPISSLINRSPYTESDGVATELRPTHQRRAGYRREGKHLGDACTFFETKKRCCPSPAKEKKRKKLELLFWDNAIRLLSSCISWFDINCLGRNKIRLSNTEEREGGRHKGDANYRWLPLDRQWMKQEAEKKRFLQTVTNSSPMKRVSTTRYKKGGNLKLACRL